MLRYSFRFDFTPFVRGRTRVRKAGVKARGGGIERDGQPSLLAIGLKRRVRQWRFHDAKLLATFSGRNFLMLRQPQPFPQGPLKLSHIAR